MPRSCGVLQCMGETPMPRWSDVLNTRRQIMWRVLFIALAFFASPALAVQTSHWNHTSEADFKKGAMHNVVASNFGDVKLSRAVKTILEEDARVSAVYALAEAPDGTIYAATGPHGVLLRIKEDKAAPLYEFEDN